MILFGHIGITMFFGGLFSLNFLPLLLGSILPDLIDKPLVLLGLSESGRFIGHTLFTGIVVSLSSFVITRKKMVPISLFFGHFVHLLEDLPFFLPWFYPFVDYDFPAYYVFGNSLTPINIMFEFIGLALLIYVIKTNPRLKTYLTKNLRLKRK